MRAIKAEITKKEINLFVISMFDSEKEILHARMDVSETQYLLASFGMEYGFLDFVNMALESTVTLNGKF